MKRVRYDLVFGLGQACSCTETLREAGLQLLSFPYDWITNICATPGDDAHEILRRGEQVCDEFSTWFRKDEFEFVRHLPVCRKDLYVSKRLDMVFNHDFPMGLDYDHGFDLVDARYRRRARRLVELIRSARRVLVVRLDRPNQPTPTTLDDCRRVRAELARRFAPVQFDFFLFSYEKGRSFDSRIEQTVEPGFIRCTFDYHNSAPGAPDYQVCAKQTASVLSSRFAVRDYRTVEEKKAYAAQRRRKRLVRLKTGLDKLLLRLRCWFHGRFNLLDDIRARRNQRKFSQFVILGFNCETAFRFYRRWGFLDSSLFAWANSGDLERLTKAIARLSELGAGTFTFHAPSRMWRCDRTRLYFHGKMKPRPGAPAPTEDELSADREDLRSRLAHLKEKFVAYATNDKPTLFVYRLGDDARLPGLDEKLTALEKALRDLGTVNGQLLVVCERADLKRMPQAPGRIFRAVSRFNPPDDVTNPKRGDSAGWNRIFTEFAPERILPKAHGFKFEDK